MAVKSEQVEKNLVKLTFEIAADKFEDAVQKTYLKNVKRSVFRVSGRVRFRVQWWKSIIQRVYSMRTL